jgi:hypothetical protein
MAEKWQKKERKMTKKRNLRTTLLLSLIHKKINIVRRKKWTISHFWRFPTNWYLRVISDLVSQPTARHAEKPDNHHLSYPPIRPIPIENPPGRIGIGSGTAQPQGKKKKG